LVTPESVTGMGVADIIELRQSVSACGSHSLNHGVKGGSCCGRGRLNEGSTCCTGRAYWGATKKACDDDQYWAPPMDGSKEDGQASCTGKPYYGVTKKASDVDQYGALSMNKSKDEQVGVPAVMPVAAPATAVVA
jgi:hypothetical protein